MMQKSLIGNGCTLVTFFRQSVSDVSRSDYVIKGDKVVYLDGRLNKSLSKLLPPKYLHAKDSEWTGFLKVAFK